MSEHSQNSNIEIDKLREYGKPKCSSKLGIHSFIVSFGLLGMVSWSLYTIIVSQISNIEKAFGLTSAETGWLMTVWEIGYVVCTAFAGYFSPRAHIPRTIGFVTIICGLSGLVCALPHFVVFEEPNVSRAINQSTDDESITDNLCLSKIANTSESLESDVEENVGVSKKTLAFILLNLGMVLMGVGKAPCYPYSVQYVDDNTDKHNTGLYISITGSISIFGLAIGFGVGSLVSKVYVTLKPTELLSTESRFVGAWWLGFLVLGLGCVVAAIPMFFFPRRILVTNQSSQISKPRVQNKSIAVVLKEIKTAAKTVWEIIKTPVYILTLLGSCFQVFAFATFFGFEPKYMEAQFAVPAWKSNIILGVSSISSYCIGSVIGGYATKRFKMTPFTMLRGITLLLITVTLVEIGMIFIGCPKREIVPPSSDLGLGCDCKNQQFLPICGADNQNYFSPCHAGCANGTLLEFTNCSVIPGGKATSGLCPTDCWMVWVYAVVRFIHNMIDAIASIPIFLVFLRSAGEDKKAFAIGLSAAIISVLSWLPGPVTGGKLIDSSCLIWKTASTSGKYCGHYDTTYQRQLLHGLQFGIRVVGIGIVGLAMYVAKKLPENWGVDDINETNGDRKEKSSMAKVI